jgi:hypothetical protein
MNDVKEQGEKKVSTENCRRPDVFSMLNVAEEAKCHCINQSKSCCADSGGGSLNWLETPQYE